MNNCSDKTPMDAETSRNFKPIDGLKPGDVLRYKGTGALKFPRKGETVIVYGTDLPVFELKSSAATIQRKDFSSLFLDAEGDILEFAMDSRHFERVNS